MPKRYRYAIPKLLILSLLFLQFSLAFHHHDSETGVHCDACVVSLSEHHSHHDGDICPIDAFYHANLVADIPVLLFAAALYALIAVLPLFREQQAFSHTTLPFSSRAPPHPLIFS